MKLALLVVATAWLALAEDALTQSGESEALLEHGCLEPEPGAWQRLAKDTLNLSDESEAVVERSSSCEGPPGGPGPGAWQHLAEDALMQSNESDALLDELEPSCVGSDGEYEPSEPELLDLQVDPTDASHQTAGDGADTYKSKSVETNFKNFTTFALMFRLSLNNLTVISRTRTKKGNDDEQTSLQAPAEPHTLVVQVEQPVNAWQVLNGLRPGSPTAGTDSVPRLPAAGSNGRNFAPCQW